MTEMQLKYLSMQEQARHNAATEAEAQRANQEQARHNEATEREAIRHNNQTTLYSAVEASTRAKAQAETARANREKEHDIDVDRLVSSLRGINEGFTNWAKIITGMLPFSSSGTTITTSGNKHTTTYSSETKGPNL